MEAFQLRLWDGRIGRWLSPDPMGQYASPYLGMGNNPIGLTDPTGGSTEDCCPDYKPSPGFPGSNTASPLAEIIITTKSKSGGFGMGANALATNDLWKFNGFNLGYNYLQNDQNYLKTKISGFNFQMSNFSNQFGLDLSADVSALKASSRVNVGNETMNLGSSAEGCILCADAALKSQFLGLEKRNGSIGYEAKVGGSAAVIKGSSSTHVSLLGTTVSYKVSASAISAAAKMHTRLYWDNEKGTLSGAFEESGALIFGIGAKFSFEIPIRSYLNAF
jgi:hypothetical protein